MEKLPTYPLLQTSRWTGVVYVSLRTSDGGHEVLEVCWESVGDDLREFNGSQEQVITLIRNEKAKGVFKPWEYLEKVERPGGVTVFFGTCLFLPYPAGCQHETDTGFGLGLPRPRIIPDTKRRFPATMPLSVGSHRNPRRWNEESR